MFASFFSRWMSGKRLFSFCGSLTDAQRKGVFCPSCGVAKKAPWFCRFF
jgi:hypothetical protein